MSPSSSLWGALMITQGRSAVTGLVCCVSICSLALPSSVPAARGGPSRWHTQRGTSGRPDAAIGPACLRSCWSAAGDAGNAVGMAGEPWREQVAYYRHRAAEYDMTSHGDLPGTERRITALTARLQPAGEVLEIACGTGLWTRHLLSYAHAVTAIDAAPEMIAVARQRVPAGRVRFCVADVLDWIPPQRSHTVFLHLLAVARARRRVRPVLVGRARCAGRRRPRAVCRRSARSRRPRGTMWRDPVKSSSGASPTAPATGSSRSPAPWRADAPAHRLGLAGGHLPGRP